MPKLAQFLMAAVIITTNRLFREWGKIFDVDNTLATAMIDRLMHHGEAIVIDGKSYRTGDGDEPATP
jgi:DNA replication protein DnaC